jgi:beta-glucosidase-like glycosyl hydrolase
MPLNRGDVYADFEIAHIIGSGPTGSVYLAHDSGTATRVALKIVRTVPSTDARFRQRLHAATQMVAGFDDPGVARVLDIGESQGRLWVATEYVDGLDADHQLRQHFPSGMPHRGVCVIADEVARALDGAHSRGLIHGDVKPTNVLLAADDRILLTDFGQGRIEDPDALRYAAPELLAGTTPDGRSDQFALAATVFQLLTAAPAFGGAARDVTEDGHVRFDKHALNDRQIGVPGLDRVFARAFAFDPAARFDTCVDFVKQLKSPASDRLAPRRGSGRPARRPVPPKPPAGGPPDPPAASGPPYDEANPAGSKGSLRPILIPAAAGLVIVLALTVGAVVLSKPRPAPQAATPTPAANQTSPAQAPAAADPECAKLDAAVANLPLRQKLAQLLMVGVKDIDDARAVVNGSAIGGIMITSWTNLSMLSGALHDLQAAPGPLPLAVSVDEEGGRVQRLKIPLGNQLSPRVLAKTDTPKQVQDIALKRGKKMRDWGITIDFAPVVDVSDEADDEVIGDRSFGNTPDLVTEYAGAYAQGLRDAGLLPVLKHFPGHGHGSGDSHLGDVTTPPLSALRDDDLVPYQKLTTVAPVAVMVGHLEVPGLTTDQPTSLTPAAYSLLRTGGYGGPPFTGLIFTDDLSSMKAISDHFGVADAVLRALQAGADIALWTSTEQVPAVLDRLEQAVNDNELDQTRVDDALSHVAAAKNPELACTR